ncbi:hypothetical protein [Sphingomonas sp. R-74633]|uniref:hypothetical protein n=1 Tax=Sphingomonas sp. R-74633 TaxID=2751188 RepID=UPI0015D3B1CF|nr:hypothetical protein [Sphingomonas sp. R-74633]
MSQTGAWDHSCGCGEVSTTAAALREMSSEQQSAYFARVRACATCKDDQRYFEHLPERAR